MVKEMSAETPNVFLKLIFLTYSKFIKVLVVVFFRHLFHFFFRFIGRCLISFWLVFVLFCPLSQLLQNSASRKVSTFPLDSRFGHHASVI